MPSITRLADYRPSDYLIDRVDLDLRLHPTETRITATLALRPNPAGEPGAPLVLDGDELTLLAIALDGQPTGPGAIDVTPRSLTLHQPPQRPFVLEIATQVNPSANTKLMGLYRSNGVYCTQCEADGFRRITYFLDRPDVMAVYTTRIEAERADAPVLLGNGNPVEQGAVGLTRHYAVWHDPHPKPAYLFAVVGGRLGRVASRFTTMEGREVEIAVHVEPGKEGRADFALDAVARSMLWDERTFGRAYDLDIFNVVAVSDFNMGAMENKGLNIFNDKYVLASQDTATDADYANIEAIIAHEYFHNWSGNRVTCRDWFQLCLKEGLTVFRDQEFSSDERSRPVHRIAEVRTLRARQFPEDAGPLAHPVRPQAIAKSTTSTPRRSTRRAPRSSGCCAPCSAPRPSGAAWTGIFPPATARLPRWRISSPPSPSRAGATSPPSPAGTSRPGRRPSRYRAATTRPPGPTPSPSARACR